MTAQCASVLICGLVCKLLLRPCAPFAVLLKTHFPDGRVVKTTAVMGGEDFGRFYRADKSIKSFIFWVGGVPAEKMAAAQAGQISLPSLHSPFWAPQADKVIATASEAMTVLALDILKKD